MGNYDYSQFGGVKKRKYDYSQFGGSALDDKPDDEPDDKRVRDEKPAGGWKDFSHLIPELRNLAGGVMGTAQNIGSSLLEGGEYLTRKGAQRMLEQQGYKDAVVPKWNAREFAGLEGDNQVDLNKIIADDPDSTTSTIGRILPLVAGGGSTLARSALGVGAISGLSADPNQKLLSSHLPYIGDSIPTGRLAAGIESALMTMIAPAAIGVVKAAKPAYSYLRPGADIAKKVDEIGGGATAQQNIANLSKRLTFARESSEAEALAPKKELINQHGAKPVDQVKNGEYFNTHEATGKDGELPTQSEIDADITKNYSKGLRDAHKNYAENPTFENADILSSKLYKEAKPIRERQLSKNSSVNDDYIYNDLLEKRNAILTDQDNFIKSLPKSDQGKYADFKAKWTTHAKKFDENQIINDLSRGRLSNIKPSSVTKEFSFSGLSPDKIGVLKDIGPSGLNEILYNELVKMSGKDVRDFAKGVNNLRNKKGFENIITPEISQWASGLNTRQNLVEGLQSILGASAGGLIGGPSYAIAGAVAPRSVYLARSLLSKIMRK